MKTQKNYTDIWTDSRKVTKGSLFICLKGENSDGHHYITDVIKKGVLEILCSEKPNDDVIQLATKKNIIITIIPESTIKTTLVQLLKKQYPISKKTKIIAVTGTDGKSSVVHFCREIAGKCGVPSASIGTIGAFITKDGKTKKFSDTLLTTPDITTMFQVIKKLEQENIHHIFLEYSSIGIHQGRLSGIPIHGAVFTTFGKDHLIYHKTIKEYREQKNRLFSEIVEPTGFAIINKKVKHYSEIKHRAKNIILLDSIKVQHTLSGIHFVFNNEIITTQFFAEYLIENLQTAIITCNQIGIPLKKIIPVIPKISGPIGRFEVVTKKQVSPLVIIDYAHTPEGLDNLLKEINRVKKQIKKKHITIVIGAGGNRDTTKRPKFGEISSRFANTIIITDDNPRKENPKIIREQIVSGIPKTYQGEISIIEDREQAIKKSLEKTTYEDIIVIVGKGHETYQIIGEKKIPFNDVSIAKKYL